MAWPWHGYSRCFECCHPCRSASVLSCVHAVMPACYHACMLSCLHAIMPACHHACMLSCPHATMPACRHVSILSCLRATWPACRHVCMRSCVQSIMPLCYPASTFACLPCQFSFIPSTKLACHMPAMLPRGPFVANPVYVFCSRCYVVSSKATKVLS